MKSERKMTVSTVESELKLTVITVESERKMTASRVKSDIKFTVSTAESECKLTVSTVKSEPEGVYSHFFFIRRLRPSIYFSPQKLSGISSTSKIFETLATLQKSPILYLDLKKNPKMHRNDP